VFKKEILELA